MRICPKCHLSGKTYLFLDLLRWQRLAILFAICLYMTPIGNIVLLADGAHCSGQNTNVVETKEE